ncbi:phage major capsid protein [Vineibacter terrae]|uniref:Phage major capsid protein n=1 Tax=Vineibacter terrae TaxID=2586908 RepID=A0A5C8PN87_9HYPH|nr:phage major capsid protein [Vineibacter terrae]TXL75627.1 phage major capsid protein [Vineibacter terrae]
MKHERSTWTGWPVLETKAADDDPDPVKAIESLTTTLNEKFTGVESEMKKLGDRLDEEIAKRNRPNTDKKSDEETAIETKAFDAFLRRGREVLTPDEAKSLRVSDDTAGGYLAPDQFVTELDRNVVLWSPVRQVATVRPTSAPAVLWPKRTGGMTGQWVGEGPAARPQTTVTFGQSRYAVCEFAAYVDVSNSMLEDSAFDIPGLLAFEFAEEFGVAEGTAFVNGAGPLIPPGFMQNADLSYTASGDASKITADGLIDVFHALPTPYRAQAVWMMNSTTLGTIRKLKDGNGNYLVLTAGLAGQVTTTILGRPVLEAPDMPDVSGGAFPIVFGDFARGYRIFDRISMSILRDPYSQATNGMTRFHGRRRVGAGVGKAEALRKLKVGTS